MSMNMTWTMLWCTILSVNMLKEGSKAMHKQQCDKAPYICDICT